jgi:hypothetical protein
MFHFSFSIRAVQSEMPQIEYTNTSTQADIHASYIDNEDTYERNKKS